MTQSPRLEIIETAAKAKVNADHKHLLADVYGQAPKRHEDGSCTKPNYSEHKRAPDNQQRLDLGPPKGTEPPGGFVPPGGGGPEFTVPLDGDSKPRGGREFEIQIPPCPPPRVS